MTRKIGARSRALPETDLTIPCSVSLIFREWLQCHECISCTLNSCDRQTTVHRTHDVQPVIGSGLILVYSFRLRHHNSGLTVGRRIIMRCTLAIIFLLTCVSAPSAATNQTVRCQEIAFSNSADAKDAEVFVAFVDADHACEAHQQWL